MTRFEVAGRIALEYTARSVLVGALLSIVYAVLMGLMLVIGDTFDGDSRGDFWSFSFGCGLVLGIIVALGVPIGSVLGLLVGLVNGIVMGILSVTVFFPLADPRRCFLFCGVLGSILSFFLMVTATPLALGQITATPFISFPLSIRSFTLSSWLVLIAVPALLAGITHWWVCYHGVRSYMASMERMEHAK